jgi:uracil-DNA glycosylase
MNRREFQKKVMICEWCALSKTRSKVVPGEGSARAQIMFIGEAPGKKEDETGRPFVGAAGKFLEEMLAIIKLKREDVFIANVVKCRPPENRDPTPEEVAACWPWLLAQIKLIRPKLIVTLGRHSMERFLSGKKFPKCTALGLLKI